MGPPPAGVPLTRTEREGGGGKKGVEHASQAHEQKGQIYNYVLMTDYFRLVLGMRLQQQGHTHLRAAVTAVAAAEAGAAAVGEDAAAKAWWPPLLPATQRSALVRKMGNTFSFALPFRAISRLRHKVPKRLHPSFGDLVLSEKVCPLSVCM